VPLVQRQHAPEQNIQFCSYSKWRPLSQRQGSPKNKYMETSATYLGKLAKFEGAPAADLVSSWKAADVKAITGAVDTALSRCPAHDHVHSINMKIFVLFPFILLVRILGRHDPHMFRYWDVTSMYQWRRSKLTWQAYAIALAGWGILLGLCFLVRWLWSKT